MKLKFLFKRFKFYSFVLAILLLNLILSACVSVTPIVPTGDANQLWSTRSDYLYQQNYWDAQLSLIGVTDEQKFKTRAVWEQRGDRYTIKLRDFIGRTVAVIEGSSDDVYVKTSKGQTYQGDTAEQLIQQLFDIQIPVAGMRYWLLGLPKPDVEVTQLMLNDLGLAERVEQQGWSMSYPSYKQADPFHMPTQIMLDYHDIDLAVKVSQWTFHAE